MGTYSHSLQLNPYFHHEGDRSEKAAPSISCALLPFHFVTSLKRSIRPQLCFSGSHTEAHSHSREGEYPRKERDEGVEEKQIKQVKFSCA
jgi:hypothetical protein